jgi:hypothetical protein
MCRNCCDTLLQHLQPVYCTCCVLATTFLQNPTACFPIYSVGRTRVSVATVIQNFYRLLFHPSYIPVFNLRLTTGTYILQPFVLCVNYFLSFLFFSFLLNLRSLTSSNYYTTQFCCCQPKSSHNKKPPDHFWSPGVRC